MKMSNELTRQTMLYGAIISFFEEKNIYKALDALGEGTGDKISPAVESFLENFHSEEIDELEVKIAIEIIEKLLTLVESKQNELTKEALS